MNGIIGCPQCQTTGGIIACPIHGKNQWSVKSNKEVWGHAMCPKHKTQFTCPECDHEFEKEVNKVMYRSLGI